MSESVDKGLAAKAFSAGQLDKAEAAIIDHAACPQRLDSGALQNHLRALGFSADLTGLWRGPAAKKEPFRRRASARAEEGLLHVMGVLRERDGVPETFEPVSLGAGARRLQHSLRHKTSSRPVGGGRLDGAVAFGEIELLRAQSRPTIGMVPTEPTGRTTTGGLANA